jgi:hypothetical protein
MNAYINTLLKINKLKRRIENARFARNASNNNNQRQIMNNRYKALIRSKHPLEEQAMLLAANIPPNNVQRLRRTKHVVSVQRISRKTIQKRRENAVMRAMARRSLVVGAHHALTPAQISRFVTPLRRRAVTVPRPSHMTRAVTALTRHLNRTGL